MQFNLNEPFFITVQFKSDLELLVTVAQTGKSHQASMHMKQSFSSLIHMNFQDQSKEGKSWLITYITTNEIENWVPQKLGLLNVGSDLRQGFNNLQISGMK